MIRVYLVMGDRVVPFQEVVAILDAQLVATAEINREFVTRAEAADRLPGGLAPECRALVVTPTAVIPTTVSARTLARRMISPRRGVQPPGDETAG